MTIWTASDYVPNLARATGVDRATFFLHRPQASHCGGYDVLAWPCPDAKAVLERIAAASEPVVVELPWDRPPIRANDRRSWQAQHRARSAALDTARWAIRAAHLEPLDGAEVTLHYRVPDRRRRDTDGPEPTKKVCIDALVLEGVLPDDDWTHVPASIVRIHPPNGRPAMWLELSEIRPKAAA